MNNLWKRLAGIMVFQNLFIDGDGGAGGGTPAGGGDGGAGAGTSSPASGGESTAASTSTTSAASGTAPLSTQESPSSLTDDGGKPVRELGETGESFLQRYRAYQKEHPVTEEPVAKTPEQLLAEKAEAEKKAAVVAETPEQKAAREKAAATAAVAAETPEQKATREATEKAEAEKRAAATPTGGEEYDLAPIPTETLAAAIKAHPAETEAFLKATGLTEDQLFANSRLAGRAGEYIKAGLPTVESARHAVARAKAFHHLDDSFTNLKAGDVAGTGKFLNDVLLPLSYLRDENGAVRVDPESKLPLTDGSVFTFLDNVLQVRHDFQARAIERGGSEEAIGHVFSSPSMAKILDAAAAVGKKLGGDKGDMIQAAALTLKNLGKKGGSSDVDLSPEVKARLDEADRAKSEAAAKLTEVQERESTAFTQKVETFKSNVLNESSTQIDNIIDKFLDGTSLKDDKFVRDTVRAKIRAGLYDSMSADSIYLDQRDAITQGGPNARTHKEWVDLNVREAKGRLRDVSSPIFAEAGVRKMTEAEQRKAQIAGQTTASQMEPKGGTGVSLPKSTADLDPHAVIEKARENLRARGEDITTENVLKERRRLMATPAA